MKNNTKQTLKIYWSHVKKYKLSGLIIAFSVLVAAVTNVVVPLYYKKFFDILGSVESGASREVIANNLFDILTMVFVIHVIGWLAWRIAAFMTDSYFPQITADLYKTCFRNLHKQSFSYFNDNFVGSLVKRVNYFVNSFHDIIDRILWEFMPMFVKITVILIVLFWHNYIFGFIIFFWIALFLTVNWFMTMYKMKYDIQRSKSESETIGFLADTIANNNNLKLFNGYEKEAKSFFNLNEKVRKLTKFTFRLDSIFEAIQILLIILLELGVFYVGIKFWEKEAFTIGDFFLLQTYVLIIFHNIFNFGKMFRRTYRNLADAEEMTQTLNTPFEITDTLRAKELKVEKGDIKFQNVSFSYHKTRKVFDKFNLIIEDHQRIALIGPSGAGKTTVIKLLLRNFDIFGGKIMIDDQDISRVTQESLWQNISLVPQDPILFHRSLLENIRYGKFKATDEEVIAASKLAHCHEFISDLPEKYDTFVGERGVKLSGGERQRVAIARAILRNAPILILDEATSSLDSHSESLIQDALDKLMKDKTVIVIAHRLSTIVKMDRIVFIDNGKVIEDGTHQQLIKKDGGHYRKLWELQAGGFITD